MVRLTKGKQSQFFPSFTILGNFKKRCISNFSGRRVDSVADARVQQMLSFRDHPPYNIRLCCIVKRLRWPIWKDASQHCTEVRNFTFDDFVKWQPRGLQKPRLFLSFVYHTRRLQRWHMVWRKSRFKEVPCWQCSCSPFKIDLNLWQELEYDACW